ncbi:HAD family hydrolase [Trichormus variabilis]|uniref:Sugar transferase n=1 Tax=Trichormus variabilis SAG 1403-4b TaxID=447716 RepID=A0A3S1BY59_ANAVA|nr:HAD family hydrolase [Trichormus variabilis]MBD2629420.1 HAD family hydrolase [Trichormus variabilis FACHB-164]RUS93580.1 sugar transferase [Trichormus variabilis SAG 1403-4b]
MQTELVIFDCDGVLVDSETLGNRVLVEFVAEFGLKLEIEEAILLFRGCKMADCVAVIEQKLGKKMPPDFVTQLRIRTAKAFENELLPVEGIEAALDKIDLPICVASSGPQEKIELALRVTNLLPRFAGCIFSSYEIGSWKPKPDLFLFAAKTMGLQPQFCTVVEDSILGVRAGIAAGMRVLWYTAKDEAILVDGAIIFESMSQLPSLL